MSSDSTISPRHRTCFSLPYIGSNQPLYDYLMQLIFLSPTPPLIVEGLLTKRFKVLTLVQRAICP